ncbi:MAG: SH3 domain-containing protein, partial [Bacteroidota bacterium]
MKNLLLVTVCLAFAIFSCGDSATPSPAESPELSLPEPGAPRGRPIPNAAPEVDEVLYPWVDRLNMRDSPGAGAGKVIAKLERRQPLTFTGEKSPRPETVVLRGLAFSEHWLKVSTKEGKEGWVHGGAVRPEGVKKGHPPISDKKFDFPAFGRFDL